MPKKGSRKVTFEGKEYRYLIKEIGISWDKALSVTIQEVTDKPGRGPIQSSIRTSHL